MESNITTNKKKLYAVIGNPIKHSLSPQIQNAAINALNLNAFYAKILLPREIDAKFLKDFIFSSDIFGLNVTLPFKEIALGTLDSIDTLAQKIGAVNTIVRLLDSKGKEILKGYNTDAFGFYSCVDSILNGDSKLDFIESKGEDSIESKSQDSKDSNKFIESNLQDSKKDSIESNNKNVLILGAGGSAKSIATILSHHNIPFTIANRSHEKLKHFEKFCNTITFDKIDSKWVSQNAFDIIVNATSSGVQGLLPLDSNMLESLFKNAKLAFDLMYSKDALTPFCNLAKATHTPFLDGKNMLVFQGAFSFLYFHNLENSKLQNIITIMNKSLVI
ncbi:shikimate dehydrogenase [Helicobacter saguini]|uniref:shikimate dehydrogenase (NADP(+)) n=1 Tax=Helicobacter saguini TaxID=1548018 RepID=A0A6B0HYG0_9HELI|nr:shikimate dehydrogenase [Helicobacter saguini]MWV61967.1 shikimate dehydrogenase [Helicobacter saguini]MWV67358.1 shikimate dehydrogenase [Helicobacter saguini]MWV69711.1 shikimate dehydrogenase [Helicobacter saguini]MWV73072.1 shikimate dehydrogenase [Helicobacter saguini]